MNKYPNSSDYQSLPNFQGSDYQSLPNYQTQEYNNSYQTEPDYGYQAPTDYAGQPQGQTYQQPTQSYGTQPPKPAPVRTEGDPLLASKTTPFDGVQEVSDATALRKTYIPKFQALFGEFFGTLVLVAVGCGSATVKPNERIGVAITFGFILMSLVQSFVPISGGHFNPVVTMCMCFSRRMSPLLGVGYFIAQMLGGLCGAGVIKGSIPDGVGFGASTLGEGVSPGRGFLIEAWMTSVLIFVVYSTAVSSRAHKKLAPLPIAVILAALIYFGGDLTGASMNPARSFGPAVVSGVWDNHWIYWIGPWLGGILGWVLYQITHFQPK
eukprot:TRINITY_DN3674_c0_g1_i1.p1 TRINITY_DN3674_c0_g1~~TRINITY_DN3674_c0_g1_i1.p1  ORF type:complete len:362 (-),score=106.78 TRINITY_DN3674_c0_g1_i1:77-1045(-)